MMKMMWWVFIFCSVAVGQDCPPPLISFEPTREYDPNTGYTHSFGVEETDTRIIKIDYYDNRSSINDHNNIFHIYGYADITNKSTFKLIISLLSSLLFDYF